MWRRAGTGLGRHHLLLWPGLPHNIVHYFFHQQKVLTCSLAQLHTHTHHHTRGVYTQTAVHTQQHSPISWQIAHGCRKLKEETKEEEEEEEEEATAQAQKRRKVEPKGGGGALPTVNGALSLAFPSFGVYQNAREHAAQGTPPNPLCRGGEGGGAEARGVHHRFT